MSYFFWAVGLALLIATLLDIGKTTLSSHGPGWLTGPICRGLWQFFRWLGQYDPRSVSLRFAASFMIGALLLTWIVLLWAGNLLLFLSDPDSVVHGSTQRHATTWEVVYFVGYNFSTMGNGDFEGNTPFWQILAAFVSFSGLVLITISITYLIPIVQAQIEKQQLSLRIHTLGRTPYQLLCQHWNGEDFSALESPLEELTSSVLQQSQQHLAYPILRYFHASDPAQSDAIALNVLDEAISLLLIFVPKAQQPNPAALGALRRALDNYLNTLRSAHIQPADNEPPAPDLAPLRQCGISLLVNDQTQAQFRALDERRRLLYALLRAECWQWSDVYVEADKTKSARHVPT